MIFLIIFLSLLKQERFDLSSQTSRCSVFILSNIGEGSSRTDKPFKYFTDITLGSSFESGTQLLIAKHRNYINNSDLENMKNKIEEFQRMTISFQNNLNNK